MQDAKTKHHQDEIDFSDLLDFPEAAAAIFNHTNQSDSAGEKHLVFALENEFYAVRSALVAEVLNPLPVTPLPGVPEWLAGVSNWRGEIIAVVNLRKYWKKNSAAPAAHRTTKGKLIVLFSPKNPAPIAFLVDRVSEIVALTPQAVRFSAADYENSFPTLSGKAVYKSKELLLFDAESLLSSLNEMAPH